MEAFEAATLEPYVDDMYDTLWDWNICSKICKDMLYEKGFKITDEFLKIVRKHFLQTRCPSVPAICDDAEITWMKSKQTRYDNRSRFYKTGYVNKETKCFTEDFIKVYLVTAHQYWVEHQITLNYEKTHEEKISGKYPINASMGIIQVTDLLKRMPDIEFEVSDSCVSSRHLNYECQTIQYLELNEYSEYKHVSRRFRYEYECSCQEQKVTKVTYEDVGAVKCPHCRKPMKSVPSDKDMHHFYLYPISFGNNPMAVYSLVELPSGESTVAFVLRKYPDSESYYGYILGVKETVYVPEEADFTTHQHAVYSIIDYTDKRHAAIVGTSVHGMDYVKAGIIASGMCNAMGRKSFNVALVGDPGTAKTKTACMYAHTMSHNSTVADSGQTTSSGMIGNMYDLKVGKDSHQIVRSGLFSSHDFVVLDEYYNNSDINEDLKNSLDSEYVTKNNAFVNFKRKKSATVFATANISPLHLAKIQKTASDLAKFNGNGADFINYSPLLCKLFDRSANFGKTSTELVEEALIEIEFSRGRCWIDGMDVTVLDRLSLLFYIRENQSDSSEEYWFDEDVPYNTLEATDAVFSPAIRDYMLSCAKTKVVFSDEMKSLFKRLYGFLRKHDRIHSNSRLRRNLQAMVEASAAINKRDYVIPLDLLFVQDIWLHTCRRIQQKYMVRKDYWNGYLDDAAVLELLFKEDFRLKEIIDPICVDYIPKVLPLGSAVPKECKSDVPTDHSVDTFSLYSTTRKIPFKQSPRGLAQNEFIFYLNENFEECKYIKKDDLNVLVSFYGVEQERIDRAIMSLIDGGEICQVDDGYKRC